MDKSILQSLAVFASWTVSSFMCHYFALMFLRDSADLMAEFNSNVIVLTSMQIAFCLVLRPVSNENDKTATRDKYIILITHICATFTTNSSMAVMHAASTFAIKLTEPVTGAISQRLFLGESLLWLQWFSIPVTVYGAIIFAEGSDHQDFKISLGTVLALLSNVCLALRNVFIKMKHQSKTEMECRKSYCVRLSVFCGLGMLVSPYLGLENVTVSRIIFLCALVIGSSLFHMLYSYISTVMVLKQVSVVSHAFVNIMKRLLVILLLYTTGSRSASTWNFIGLFICITGLAVYVWSKTPASCPLDMKKIKCTALATNVFVLMASVMVVVLLFRSHAVPHHDGGSLRKLGNGGDSNSDQLPHSLGNLSLYKSVNFSVSEFYLTDLVANPEEANKLSPLISTRPCVINEAQRIHMNIFKTVIGKYKYAMLFGFDRTENKGDPAIAVGVIILLNKLDIKIVFSVDTDSCTKEMTDKAYTLSKNYNDKDLVILFSGGGNVVSSHDADNRRFLVIERFKDFHIVMFPQSIIYIGLKSRIDYCKKMYASHKRLTFAWRDKYSYKMGKELFPNVQSLMSPDMAYQIGFMPRFMDPTHDIIWIRRGDSQSPKYAVPANPSDYRMHVSDWLQWKTPTGTSTMEDIFLITTIGLTFLQRGRVVVTDRLHGHILSTLLGIPHVYIDNVYLKISNYHNTWTAGLENVILANSSADALVQAKKLLVTLGSKLPKIAGHYTN